MHLINTSTYEVEQYIDPGPYAILSHTWHDGEEVLHREFIDNHAKARTKKGFRKVKYLCAQAIEDQLELAWIDTVCIDKTSSAELSEAINSMFAWYQEAQICYVFLDDVDQVSDIPSCRWITRGWTLQELLAPEVVRFYNRDWVCIGTKVSLAAELARCTRIDHIALTDAATIPRHSAATRMSWVASRRTTRIEDMAYCLLGLFGVNMPLLYGERGKAFIRLQEQILREYRDLTILAFNREGLDFDGRNILAASPDVFGKMPKIVNIEDSVSLCEVTSRGLQLRLRLLKESIHDDNRFVAILDCRFEFDPDHRIAIPILPWSIGNNTSKDYLVDNSELRKVKHSQCLGIPHEDILVLHRTYLRAGAPDLTLNRFTCSLKAHELLAHGYEVIYGEPEGGVNSWDSKQLVSEVVIFTSVLIRKFAFVHRQHNEAFIVMIAAERSGPRSTWHGQRVWVNMEAKPFTADCATWLKQHEMYGVLKQPSVSSQWHTKKLRTVYNDCKVVDGIIWHLFGKPARSSSMALSLLSTKSYEEVRVDVSRSSPGSFSLVVDVTPREIQFGRE